jgi:antitoxin HigA-1
LGVAHEGPRIRTHPGEVLAQVYMKPLGLSANAPGKAADVPGNRISEVVRGRRDVSADAAIRLGRFFDVDPRSG